MYARKLKLAPAVICTDSKPTRPRSLRRDLRSSVVYSPLARWGRKGRVKHEAHHKEGVVIYEGCYNTLQRFRAVTDRSLPILSECHYRSPLPLTGLESRKAFSVRGIFIIPSTLEENRRNHYWTRAESFSCVTCTRKIENHTMSNSKICTDNFADCVEAEGVGVMQAKRNMQQIYLVLIVEKQMLKSALLLLLQSS